MVHLPAPEGISLALRQSPGTDETSQPRHAVIEALNELGKASAFMPGTGNKHRLIQRLDNAKLFHGRHNVRMPACGQRQANAGSFLKLVNVHVATSIS